MHWIDLPLTWPEKKRYFSDVLSLLDALDDLKSVQAKNELNPLVPWLVYFFSLSLVFLLVLILNSRIATQYLIFVDQITNNKPQ